MEFWLSHEGKNSHGAPAEREPAVILSIEDNLMDHKEEKSEAMDTIPQYQEHQP